MQCLACHQRPSAPSPSETVPLRSRWSWLRAAIVVRCCAAFLALWAAPSVQAQPQRVVSINLCTDQLALMLAAPGQLISVSRLSHDPQSSTMAEAARKLPANASTAEDVYLLRPDLVLAGTFTSAATVNMLRDLGIPVERFAPARALADVPDRLAQMGRALGRETQARQMIDRFRADLDHLSDAPMQDRLRAALSYVNNYSSGDKTLAGDILRAAGFDNAASEIGLSSVGRLTLEDLILLAPDVIIQGRDYPGTARAEDNLRHPALRALRTTRLAEGLTDRDWICGTPQVLQAIGTMRALRLEFGVAR